MQRAATVLALTFVLGCASPQPVLYPNPHYESVGSEVAEVEIEECRVRAAEGGASDSPGEQAGEIAGTAATRSAAGAAAGAVGGAIRGGNVGVGAAVGAATSATWTVVAGSLRWLFEGGSGGDGSLERRFIERCLEDRGYEVIGWD